MNPLIRLNGQVQHYDWGMHGPSRVASLGSVTDHRPCAEFWVGAHPSKPSLTDAGERLDRLIAQEPARILGSQVSERFAGKLPFLFKVLSVGKALSIQSHPDLELAKQLHHEKPDRYPDDNHKPEVAIALSHFRYLAGFQTPTELRSTVESMPELCAVLGAPVSQQLASGEGSTCTIAIRAALRAIFTAPQTKLDPAWDNLHNRLRRVAQPHGRNEVYLRIMSQFPHDRGVFAAALLRYGELVPGEAIYLRPNLLHAYLSGEIIEVMANSDNVIRAGLTSKWPDVDTLLRSVDCSPGQEVRVEHSSFGANGATVAYDLPVAEFAVKVHSLSSPEIGHSIVHSPTLIVCLEGEAHVTGEHGTTHLSCGQSVLVTAEARGVVLRGSTGRCVEVSVPPLRG